jgi:polyisoprenoid-binding protein YceI
MNAKETTKWVMDSAHSSIGFKVKHLMISNVSGIFKEASGEVTTVGNDWTSVAISVMVNAASVFTDAPDRDGHLKSPDFFDVEKYPELKFTGNGLKSLGDDKYELAGELTMKDITKPVTLAVEFGGLMTDPWGNTKAGFTVTGKINRKDWGLNWNAALETGGVLVSEEVRINSEVQFAKQA